MNKQNIIEFLDEWLDENGWRADSRTQDLVLDLRLMLEDDQQAEEQDEQLVGSSA